MRSRYTSLAGNIITPFPLESVTTNNFAWLHPTAWSHEDGNFWAKHRCSQPHTFLKSPPFVLKRHKKCDVSVGKWILSANQQPVAWAEAHFFGTSFGKSLIAIDAVEQIEFPQVSLLISAILINSDSDLVQLAPLSDRARTSLEQLSGEKDWWLPPDSRSILRKPEGTMFAFKEMTANQWWELEQGKQDRETLSYLVKRHEFQKERAARQERQKQRPRYRGLFGLFRPWGR